MNEELDQISEKVSRIKQARADEIEAVVAQMKQELSDEEREYLCQAILVAASDPQSYESRKYGQLPGPTFRPGNPGTPDGNLAYAYGQLCSGGS